MDCDHCIMCVTSAAEGTGAEDVRVNLADKQVDVRYDENTLQAGRDTPYSLVGVSSIDFINQCVAVGAIVRQTAVAAGSRGWSG